MHEQPSFSPDSRLCAGTIGQDRFNPFQMVADAGVNPRQGLIANRALRGGIGTQSDYVVARALLSHQRSPEVTGAGVHPLVPGAKLFAGIEIGTLSVEQRRAVLRPNGEHREGADTDSGRNVNLILPAHVQDQLAEVVIVRSGKTNGLDHICREWS